MSYSIQVEDFESIEDEWERILPLCQANTIFVTPLWQQLWWRHFGRDSRLHILSLAEGGERLGIAPLILGDDGNLSFLGDTDLFDYHDFLVIEGKEAAFYRRALGPPNGDGLAHARPQVSETGFADIRAACPRWQAEMASRWRLLKRTRHQSPGCRPPGMSTWPG